MNRESLKTDIRSRLTLINKNIESKPKIKPIKRTGGGYAPKGRVVSKKLITREIDSDEEPVKFNYQSKS